ncbi:hypothetical protein BX600DRAFT_398784 [Xylariales sp. PMI_506]|nr:hypothetical protein BX600DRAFT_398784 [Xylariales sp. PMI_506]
MMWTNILTVSVNLLAVAGLARADNSHEEYPRAQQLHRYDARVVQDGGKNHPSSVSSRKPTSTSTKHVSTYSAVKTKTTSVASSTYSTAKTKTTSVASSSSAACAIVSSSWAAQLATAPEATPTVLATLAYECLTSVPLGKEAAIELVDAIEPYLEWQSDSAYKADPPADYPYPAYDMFANLAAVKTKLENDTYANEYEFQADLYLTVFAPGHDGHFVFYPDALTAAFGFIRQVPVVSISEDGSSLPVIKAYHDVVSNPNKASELTHINGVEAATFIEDLMKTASYNQDLDAAYNTAFFSLASQALGFPGYFAASGRVNHVYHGAQTTFTFANGTELTLDNKANVIGNFTGVVDGESYYNQFCVPSSDGSDSVQSSQETALSSIVVGPGYPDPVYTTNDSIVSCYYLDGEEYKDVVVIALLAMESESITEFQSVVQECIAGSLAAGKTKLVVDFQGNGGGYILLGYDFYRELFPQIQEDGYSRWRESDSFLAAAKVDSDLVAGIDPYTSDNAELVGDWEWWFNYRYDYDISGKPFATYEDKFAPHVYQDTNYTNIMRWNLNDNLTTINSTYGMGIWIAGYGALANLTQPFEAENIVLLYDGVCASTCTIASEMLRIQGGVKSIAMGGRPVEGAIQGVGGVKGSESLGFADVYDYAAYFAEYAEDEEQAAAFARYSSLPIERSTASGINARDQILRGNVEDGLPAQYVVEPADCRLYWTAPMLSDVTEVWKAAAGAAFNGDACAYGGISSSSSGKKGGHKRAASGTSPDAVQLAPRIPDEKRAELFKRSAAQNDPLWNARYRVKATP